MIPHDVHLILASGLGWGAALLLAAFGGALVVLAYRRHVRRVAGARWMVPAFFRMLGTVALLLLLLRPELDIEKTRVDARTLLLLLDRSGSLVLRDEATGPQRLRRAALAARDCERALGEAGGLVLRVVPFSEGVDPAVSGKDILELEATGEETDLASAFRLAARMAPPVQRVLLISDGNDTTGLDPVPAAAALGVPVDAVAVGQDRGEQDARRDIALDGVEHRDSAPVGSVTQVVANVEATGFAGRAVEVLLRSGSETLARGEIVLDAHKGSQPVPLNFHPQTPGVMDLTVTVTPLAGARLAQNNTLSFPLAVHEQLPRVVYVEGSIRPSYKFLRKVLATDPGIEFMSLVRVREGDFLRQGAVGGLELEGLPRSEAEFASFDVFLLGDLAAQEVGDPILRLLQEAVSGGMGLLILPAPSTVGPGSDYAGSPLARLFPAIPRRASAEGAFRPLLTAAGHDHPLGEGLAPFFGGEDASGSPLALNRLDRVERVRPTASVVLSAASGEQNLPVLVTGRFGKGKVALFLGRDAWQWSLGRRDGANGYAQLWGQIVRWLASPEGEAPAAGAAFSVTADRLVVRAGEPVVFSATVRGREGPEPATVAAVIFRGREEIDRIAFTPVPGLQGAFEARFASNHPGRYRVRVRALAGSTELGMSSIEIRVRGGRGEFERLSPNRKLLARLARETGGVTVPLEELADHAAALGERQRTKEELVHVPLWHGAGLFLALAVCFSLEWIFRKHAGLP